MAQPFKTEEEIENWLKTQPREVISIFAARAVLRAVPMFTILLETKEGTSKVGSIILPTLWAVASTLSSGIWPDRAEVNTAINANDAVYAVVNAHHSSSFGDVYSALTALISAAGDAAHVGPLLPKITYGFAQLASAVTTASAADSLKVIYLEYSLDRNFIDSGKTAFDLAHRHLWGQVGGIHSRLRPELDVNWRQLKAHLLSLGQDWHVWTAWYDDRVHGNTNHKFAFPFNEDIEIGINSEQAPFGRTTLPTDYYKDPTKANAAIRKIIKDYWDRQEIPPQDPTAETFAITPEGSVISTTQEVGASLLNEPSQLEWYEELRDTISSAQSLGGNKLGKIAGSALNSFAEALPENISHARVARIWPRGNKIRRIIGRHDGLSEEDFDPDRLNPEVAEYFRDIIGIFNNLRIGDPALLAADQNAASPREAREILENIEPLKPMLLEVLDKAEVSEEAAAALEVIATLDTHEVALQNAVMGRLDVVQKEKVLRNFITAKIKWVRDEPHKAAGAVFLMETFVSYGSKCIKFLKDHPFLQDLLRSLLG